MNLNRLRWYATVSLAAVLALAAAAHAQQGRGPHIGYVFPAGARQGVATEIVVGGQFLDGTTGAHISGPGVTVELVEYFKPISQGQQNRLRYDLELLLARKNAAAKGLPEPPPPPTTFGQAVAAGKIAPATPGAKGAPAAATPAPATPAAKGAPAAATPAAPGAKGAPATATPAAATPAAPAAAPVPTGPPAKWSADDDAVVAEIRKKLSTFVRRPSSPAIVENVTLKVTLAPDAAPGRREIRLLLPTGPSNPLVFYVGQLPEFSEKPVKISAEPTRSVPGDEMSITIPATINGQIMAGGVDRWRFQARAGQKLVFSVLARELIPYISDAVPGWFQATLTMFDAQGKEVAYADDFRFSPDPVLYFQIPKDGEYTAEIKDSIYRGREDFVYRMSISESPFVTSIFPLGGKVGAQTVVELKGWNLPVARYIQDATGKPVGTYPFTVRQGSLISNSVPFEIDTLPECLEQEPNQASDKAQAVTFPMIINGRINLPADRDVFRFEAKAGDQIVAEVYARRLNSPLDSIVQVTDAAGKQVAVNDDFEDKGAGLTTHHADSRLVATMPAAGTYYLTLTDAQRKGGPDYAYRLRLSRPQADFDLRIAPSSIRTSRGGTASTHSVFVVRRDGFAGDVTVTLKDAPPGFKLSGGKIAAGQDETKVTVAVAPTTSEKPFSLQLEGRATILGKEVVRPVIPAEDMMQAFAYRHLVLSDEFLVLAPPRGSQRPAIKITSSLPVKIPAGGTVRVRMETPPGIPVDRLHMELSEPPAGIAIKNVLTATGGADLVLQSDAAKVKPGFKGNLVVTVTPRNPDNPKGKAAGRGATLPSFPFEIVTP